MCLISGFEKSSDDHKCLGGTGNFFREIKLVMCGIMRILFSIERYFVKSINGTIESSFNRFHETF